MDPTNLLFAAVSVVSFVIGKMTTKGDYVEQYKRGVQDGTSAMLRYLTPYLKEEYLDKDKEGKSVH